MRGKDWNLRVCVKIFKYALFCCKSKKYSMWGKNVGKTASWVKKINFVSLPSRHWAHSKSAHCFHACLHFIQGGTYSLQQHLHLHLQSQIYIKEPDEQQIVGRKRTQVVYIYMCFTLYYGWHPKAFVNWKIIIVVVFTNKQKKMWCVE